jgi:hypothetical protein
MDCDDRSPVRRLMSTKPIDAQETPATEELPAKRKSAPKKSKPLLQCATPVKGGAFGRAM